MKYSFDIKKEERNVIDINEKNDKENINKEDKSNTNNNILGNDNKDNIIKEKKNEKINIKLDNDVNLLIKNKLDLMHSIKKNKENKKLFNSNWNHSSNFKLTTFANENLLYKNKFMKNTPLKDKILNENNRVKGIILPEIKSPTMKRDNININNNIFSHFTKIPKEALVNNINNENKNELSSDTENLFRNIKLNKIISNNNDTQTTQSATNSTKNQTSSKNNFIPNINDGLNKYEMGLISGGSTTNNNIIIPILAMKRPTSNLNCGGKIIYNMFDLDINKGNNKKYEKSDKFDLINCHLSQNTRNKNFKLKEQKKITNISMKNKEVFNILSGVQKLIPNFHKIKIEKGMTSNNKLINSYSKKITYDYKSKNNINFQDSKLKFTD